MALSPQMQRAFVLQQQNRHVDAERELRQHLATDPRDAYAHAMLADSLVELSRFDEAEQEAKESIGIAPDEAFGHAVMARLLRARNRFKSAEIAIREAIAIDSNNPSYFAILAATLLDLRRWRDALDAANEGLAIDPKDSGCLNLRAMALTQLGDRDAAASTTEGALADDPENALAHATHGWTLLHQNDPRRAMEHFREALRLDPTMDYARTGILESMKARNPFYRLMLRYFLFMSRLDSRVQWGIVLGGFFGARILRSAANRNPDLAPFIWPVLILYIAFALSTWLAPSLFNLLLRLHPFGKHVLDDDERRVSTLTGIALGTAAIFGVSYLVTGALWALIAGVVGLLVSLPLSRYNQCHVGWPRRAMVGILVVLVTLGLTASAFTFNDPEDSRGSTFFTIFIYGCLLSQFGASALNGIRPER
ncbi:MAG TPA: tetratricopeptide repeat protein [Tepidisphaeraceae bacterium]|jgi:tetratricopeptide (TPR) repeat protein|nr:tetratricopeptide repeat protein [Tepidisphaeraceae bacterium]